MRIEPNDNATELSYLDLLTGIKHDIQTDRCMPETVKRKLFDKIERIESIISPYSN